MVTAHQATCQLGGQVRNRCRNPVTGFCQYCGRAFCDEHGTHAEDYQEVCVREVCQAKFADVYDFKPYKRRVHQRNAFGLCGVEDCMGRLWGSCSKCEGIFCMIHITRVVERRRAGRRSWRQPLAACPRCAQRLTIWNRD